MAEMPGWALHKLNGMRSHRRYRVGPSRHHTWRIVGLCIFGSLLAQRVLRGSHVGHVTRTGS